MRVDLIDNFRAMAMLYVIFIHTMFWFKLFPPESFYNTLFLIEMPLFFIVTGMANWFARTENVSKFYISRLKRILIPFWIFAFICASVNILHLVYKKIILEASIYPQILIQWLNPFGEFPSIFPYLNYATWFIPVYLELMLVIPLLKKIFQSESNLIKVFPLLILPALLFVVQCENLDEKIFYPLFYGFWIYVGFFLHDVNKFSFSDKLPICISITVLGIVLTYFFYRYLNFSLNMQINKFPPNIIFLSYNLSVLPILFLFCNQINYFLNLLADNKYFGGIFKIYRDFCYTVYLYHPFAFLILEPLVQKLNLNQSGLTPIIVCQILIIGAAFTAKIFIPFENIRAEKR